MTVLAACGTSTSSTISNADSHRATQAQADGNNTAPALTANAIAAFTNAYASLDDSIITQNTVTAFAADVFVDIDVSAPLRSASFGHTTTVRVPAGSVAAPTDPNAATEFYVVYGASTNHAGGSYGPFVITENGLGMAAAQAQAIVAASQALADSDFTCPAEAFASDARFAEIDNTPRHQSASFGHTITLLVPAGMTDAPADADLATTYYVQLGASTNAAGGTYGPFALTSANR